MKSLWLEKVIDSVADRGRELLKLRANDASPRNIENLCRSLISQKGEASGTALAREVITEYNNGASEERLAFFEMLHARFGYDETAMLMRLNGSSRRANWTIILHWQRPSNRIGRSCSDASTLRQMVLRRL